MNVRYCESTRNPRIGERSVVSPSVMIDSPPSPRPRKTASSITVAHTRTSARQRRPKVPPQNDDYRYFIDRQGRQHFNFRQRVWLDASVQMACTRGYSLALETLALNLLTMVTRTRWDSPHVARCYWRRRLAESAYWERRMKRGHFPRQA
jgi:hypothetical protein